MDYGQRREHLPGVAAKDDDDVQPIDSSTDIVRIAVGARFQPFGMARAMVATALAQALVAVLVLISRNRAPAISLQGSLVTGI